MVYHLGDDHKPLIFAVLAKRMFTEIELPRSPPVGIVPACACRAALFIILVAGLFEVSFAVPALVSGEGRTFLIAAGSGWF